MSDKRKGDLDPLEKLIWHMLNFGCFVGIIAGIAIMLLTSSVWDVYILSLLTYFIVINLFKYLAPGIGEKYRSEQILDSWRKEAEGENNHVVE